MRIRYIAPMLLAALPALPLSAQRLSDLQLKIDSSNRTLAVGAEQRVTAEPDIAVLHIGFETPISDAKSAYAAGAKASNQIISAIRHAGIPESDIRSEAQSLDPIDFKAHRFRLTQYWAVKVPPTRAAEILDIAISAGATDSGRIEWTVADEKALEDQALQQAAARARSDAEALARGMGVRLGPLAYVSNQVSGPTVPITYEQTNFAADRVGAALAPPLAIEPHKVSRTATVYAVFAIE